MEKTKIFEVLVDWNLWGDYNQETIDRPEYLNKLKKLVKTGQITVVKGVRRTGKTTLTHMLAETKKKESSLFINFEDPRFPSEMNAKDILEIYDTYIEKVNPENPELVVLDEVQKVSEWEKTARYLMENKGLQVIVTGSSSKLMSEEYETVLTGRHVDLEVFPLSFKEFLRFKKVNTENEVEVTKNKNKIKRMLSEYVEYGGFPKVVLNKEKEEYLRAYFKDIITKDIARRYSIKEITKLEELTKWYLNNISTLQSYNKIRKYLNTSLNTVERHSKYLNNARMVFFVPKFSYSLKSQLQSPKKVYCVDTGFYNVAGFALSKNTGRLYENIVAMHLLKNKEVYYWKNGVEVDFLIKEKNKVKELIQVTQSIENPQTKEREVKSLLKASKELNCKNLTIINDEYEGQENGIKYVPLWKWLLLEN